MQRYRGRMSCAKSGKLIYGYIGINGARMLRNLRGITAQIARITQIEVREGNEICGELPHKLHGLHRLRCAKVTEFAGNYRTDCTDYTD